MMSHRTTIAFTFGLLSSAVYAQAPKSEESEQPIKIRIIDSSATMQLTEVGKLEAKKIDALAKELKDALENKEKQITETMTNYKAKAPALSPEARDKEEQKIIAMRNDLQSTGQASDEQYKHAVQRATEKLSKEIETAVTKIAQEQDLDLVMDLYTGRPVFASNRIVITDDIIKTMDANFAKTKKPAEKKPEAPKTNTPKKSA